MVFDGTSDTAGTEDNAARVTINQAFDKVGL
jgi:hypothetical protein